MPVIVELPDCPDCPHPDTEHGTYGCLYGWHWDAEGVALVQGCKCANRRLETT